MIRRVCIIGTGPTGIFTLQRLVQSDIALAITLFESEQQAGKGTPYLPGANDPVMLSNIPSIEIPPLAETLVAWLTRQDDAYLARFGIVRAHINGREFYPRLVLGDYFHDQFQAIIADGLARGHRIDVRAGHRVVDIELFRDDIRVCVANNAETIDAMFDHVVMATGHNWPEDTQVAPGYFSSPWPAAALKAVCHGRLGVLGTSLTGIDALLTVASSFGSFLRDEADVLFYQPAADGEDFSSVMMSRKGLLPEADFYCPLPYLAPHVCTQDAVLREISRGSAGLLDRVFELFRQELLAVDPDYAQEIGLGTLTVDTFADAYYGRRSDVDPFVWAAANLAEAEFNIARQCTIPWRYAFLTTHEIIEKAVEHFDADDLRRFNRSFKGVFIDEYATVPHLSIKRLLALHNAGRLEIMTLGEDYTIDTDGLSRGARIRVAGREERFDSFIDATGQSALAAHDLPFPTLVAQQGVREALTADPTGLIGMEGGRDQKATGGIEVDADYRPRGTGLLSNRLYCVAIPFLLHKHPFVQGITSAAEMGEIAANAILRAIHAETSSERLIA